MFWTFVNLLCVYSSMKPFCVKGCEDVCSTVGRLQENVSENGFWLSSGKQQHWRYGWGKITHAHTCARVHTHTQKDTHTHKKTHTHTHTLTHTHMHAHTHVHTHTHTHTQTRTHVYTHTHKHKHSHTHTHTQHTHTHTHTHTHAYTHTHTHTKKWRLWGRRDDLYSNASKHFPLTLLLKLWDL